MIKRIVCLMMMFLIASSALAVTPAKKKSPEKPAKKAVKVKQKATKQKSTVIEDEKTDETQQLREDTNKAVAELKSQIDSVKADNSDAKVGGVIFFRWAKPASNTQFNNFDIDRAYVDIRKKLAGGSAMRVTLDVARLTTAMDTAKANQHLFDYLKYAYVDVPISLPKQSQIIPFNATAKLGLQHTVWIDWMDKIMDIRFIAKSLVDNKGLMSSADFGIGAAGKFTVPMLPEIEYHGTLLNGTGYKAVETNNQKDLSLRLNSDLYVDPMYGKVTAGTFISLLGFDSKLTNTAGTKAGLAVAYRSDLGTVYGEYYRQKGNIAGTSIGAMFNAQPLVEWLPLSAFVRADVYSPTMNLANTDVKDNFYGIIWNVNKDMRIALDHQTSQTGSAAQSGTLYVHMETKY